MDVIKILYTAIKYSKHTEKEPDVVAHICILILTAGSSQVTYPGRQFNHQNKRHIASAR